MRQWRKQHRHFTERNTDETHSLVQKDCHQVQCLAVWRPDRYGVRRRQAGTKALGATRQTNTVERALGTMVGVAQ